MSSRATHTPGPWTVGVHDETTSIESTYETIAPDVGNGNAYLIAAAPELLEACEMAFGAIEALITERPMNAAKLAGSSTLGNHRAAIKAAIVKATANTKVC